MLLLLFYTIETLVNPGPLTHEEHQLYLILFSFLCSGGPGIDEYPPPKYLAIGQFLHQFLHGRVDSCAICASSSAWSAGARGRFGCRARPGPLERRGRDTRGVAACALRGPRHSCPRAPAKESGKRWSAKKGLGWTGYGRATGHLSWADGPRAPTWWPAGPRAAVV